MRITDIEMRLEDVGMLKAYIRLKFDREFVIDDCKLIEPQPGKLVVAMPSRRRMEPCLHCGRKNPILSFYCSDCGRRLPRQQWLQKHDSVHADVCFPIRNELREHITALCIQAYRQALLSGEEEIIWTPPAMADRPRLHQEAL